MLFSYSPSWVSICDSLLAGFQSTSIVSICGWSWASFSCSLGGVPCHCTHIGLELLYWQNNICIRVEHSSFLRLKWVIAMSSNQSIFNLKATLTLKISLCRWVKPRDTAFVFFLRHADFTGKWWTCLSPGQPHYVVETLLVLIPLHFYFVLIIYGSIIFSWSNRS